MKDPNLFLLIGTALLLFAAIATYLPTGVHHLARKTRSRPPHRALITVARLWFALLALGCVALLILPLLPR